MCPASAPHETDTERAMSAQCQPTFTQEHAITAGHERTFSRDKTKSRCLSRKNRSSKSASRCLASSLGRAARSWAGWASAMPVCGWCVKGQVANYSVGTNCNRKSHKKTHGKDLDLLCLFEELRVNSASQPILIFRRELGDHDPPLWSRFKKLRCGIELSQVFALPRLSPQPPKKFSSSNQLGISIWDYTAQPP